MTTAPNPTADAERETWLPSGFARYERDLEGRPATLFAAGFIGTPPMNLLTLKVPEVAHWAQRALDGGLPGEDPHELVMGVRPEKIRLADSGLAADVTGLEYLGADTLIACKVGTSEVIVRQEGKARLAVGDRVYLAWPESDNHWFDAQTGSRRNR